MFGKDRNTYVARDVYSDEEDREADALEVEHEEMYRCVHPLVSVVPLFILCAILAVRELLGRRMNWLLRRRNVTRRRSAGGRRRRMARMTVGTAIATAL